MKSIYYNYYRLLERVKGRPSRNSSLDVNWNAPLVGLLGPQGVGKTTLLLAHILHSDSAGQSLYVNAGDMFFCRRPLSVAVGEFVAMGVEHLYIDDLHLIGNYKNEILKIHTSYPHLKVVYAGSALMRRRLPGEQIDVTYLTLREYLNASRGWKLRPSKLEDFLAGRTVDFPIATVHPEDVCKEYLICGCYPFCQEKDFEARVFWTLNKTLSEEIPRFARMTAPRAEKLRALASLLLEEAPTRPNFLQIERELGINRNDISEYLQLLEGAGTITIDREDENGIHKRREVVRAVNPNIARLYSREWQEEFWEDDLFQLWTHSRPGFRRHAPGLYELEGHLFRIAKIAKKNEVADPAKGEILVTNEVEIPCGNKIPLWAFGFLSNIS